MSEVERRPCKACRMPIEIHMGPNGRPIPLQKVRSVYVLRGALFGAEITRSDVTDHAEAVFVSHFETCPNAGEFSRNRRPRPNPSTE